MKIHQSTLSAELKNKIYDNYKSKMPELLFLWFFWHVPCGIFYFLIGYLVKFKKDNL